MAKVMLCDDSPTILALLERKLKESGHEVVAKARDGEQGTLIYDQSRPDVLILDVTMPNKDGRECLRDIMARQHFAKVIMLTALKDEAIVHECMGYGAKAFLSKSNIQDASFGQDLSSLITKVAAA
jgi:two-component system chemotaxis response regulator CheY